MRPIQGKKRVGWACLVIILVNFAAGNTTAAEGEGAKDRYYRWAFLIPIDAKRELVVITPRTDAPNTVSDYPFLYFKRDKSKEGWTYSPDPAGHAKSLEGDHLVAMSRLTVSEYLRAPLSQIRVTGERDDPALARANQRAVKLIEDLAPKTPPLIDYYSKGSSLRSLQLVPMRPRTPPIPAPTKSPYQVSACGVVDNAFFSRGRFATGDFPLARYTSGPVDLSSDDLERVEHWLLGFSTVNNVTYGASQGTDVFGTTLLITSTEFDSLKKMPLIHYQTIFFGICKPKAVVKSTDSPEHYGFQPQADIGLLNLPGVSVIGKATSLIPSWMTITPPLLDNDKAYGISQSMDIGIDFGKQDGYPTLDLTGQNSFEHDYYQAGGKMEEAVGESGKFSAKVGKELKPKNNEVEDDTSGGLAYDWTVLDSKHDSHKTGPEAYNVTIEFGAGGVAKDYRDKTTDEYSLTFNPQAKYYFLNPAATQKAAAPISPDAEIDGAAWIVPTDSAPGTDYSDAVAQIHSGGDFPVHWAGYDDHDRASKFIRLDFSLTGGGILGKVPAANDYFYGGNNLKEGVASAMPSPVIRSFGSGQASVDPEGKGKTTGADSFGSLNFTAAIPIPYLSYGYPVISGQKNIRAVELQGIGTDGKVDDLLSDRLDYFANFLGISFKPLLAFDGAWLGAPSGYHNRSLASLGGGGELSIGSVNLDLLYDVTVHDSAGHSHGENLVFQATYDFHF